MQLAEEEKIKSGISFFRIGALYEYGEGVSQNYLKAIDYYLLGASRNEKCSLKYVVSLIKNLDKNLQEEYLKKAFALNCEGAAYELGNIEENRINSRNLSDKAKEYYINGAEAGDIPCNVKLLRNYSYMFANRNNKEDRIEALKWFQIFFANIDGEYLEFYRKNNILSTFYCAYAIELDYDPYTNLPDRKFAQFYYKKSLAESLIHFEKITEFIVGAYLFPDDTSSKLNLDVVYVEEMLEWLGGYLQNYYDYINTFEKTERSLLWRYIIDMFYKGYLEIAECYKVGRSVKKNKGKHIQYKEKADEICAMLNYNDNFIK